MAETQFTVDFTPPKEGLKKDVAITATLVDPGLNEMWVGFGSGVATRRSTEIVNGLRWLMEGVSERNLLDVQFNGFDLVTAVDIDNITDGNRRTSSDLATSTVGVNDLVLSYGGTVTGNGQIGMMRTGIDSLIRAVQEYLYKNG